MTAFKQVGLALMVVYVACTVSVFYQQFHSPRCPTGAMPGDCLEPLLEEGELVDMYVYVTGDGWLKWWTPDGLAELQQTPLWNVTSTPFGRPLPATSVTVPLSSPGLHGVRSNTSTLYAHCYLVRAGAGLTWPETGPSEAGYLSPNVLHASGAISRLLPVAVAQHRSLLSESADDEEDAPVAPRGHRKELPPVAVELPWGSKTSVYPRDTMVWASAAFIVTAFLPPSWPLAVPRHIILVGVLPYCWQLWQDQLKKQREQDRLDMLWWEQVMAAAPEVPHIVPKVRLSLAADSERYDARYKPPLLYKEMVFQKGSLAPYERSRRYMVVPVPGDGAGDAATLRYVPPLAIDSFDIRRRYWRPLDPNVSHPDPIIGLELEVNGMIRYTVMETVKQTFEMYIQMGITERTFDDVRDFLFRHPLHIMALMQVISMVQLLLTTLAFKNDISFFRGRSDYTGLSSRSLATDTLQEIIIFLYLWDFDDISRLVLFQLGASVTTSAWKFTRVARLGLSWEMFLPWISYNRGWKPKKLEDGQKQEEKGSDEMTDEIDARGMFYLKIVLYPLSMCWGLYNLYHYRYKSWWSWLVSSMADFAYTFGFINMMPQIFINYKLKSVAHMPWRVLIYKFFHTFIDDVYAFFIMSDYMSKKHRWMTLRDDVVFFVFLYQRHLYQVDPNRPDEFGFTYADAAKPEKPETSQKDAVGDVAETPGEEDSAAPRLADDLPPTEEYRAGTDSADDPSAEK